VREGLGKLKIHLIGTRTRDLPSCSIMSQPTTLPRELANCFYPQSSQPKIPFLCLKSNIANTQIPFPVDPGRAQPGTKQGLLRAQIRLYLCSETE
jgi:hypothetical protein